MGKQKKLKLAVPNPCSEDWDKMIVKEQGHFCSSCQKFVIDFSSYADKELLDYFVNVKDKICGRISGNQLNRLIAITEPANTPAYKRFLFGAALTAGVASTAHSQNMPPQGGTIITGTVPTHQKANKEKPPVSDSTFKISGRVIDSASKKALSSVNVLVTCDSNVIAGTYTNINGKFEANVNKHLLGKKLTIMATQYGFHDVSKDLTFTKIPTKYFTIKMSKIEGFNPVMIMGDIIEVPPEKDSGRSNK